MRLRDADTGRIIAANVEMADTSAKRAVGLLGRRGLEQNSALWLEPCNGIHTFGMRFAIDVLYLDKAGIALRVLPNVRPNRMRLPLRGVRVTVEFPAGTLAALGVKAGGRYLLEKESGEKESF